ncbi:Crp/Fnr family transcriptional regulator [Sphingobacterium faecium]|uniref:Crp/Fnr family transcriptional regulator n=1 Tax=Sphingobacterium faecium TaxID=34087 RepID=UPI003209BC40
MINNRYFFDENSEFQKIKHLFKLITLPAKSILLNEGDIATNIFFIKKGCLRVGFNNDGQDITFQFFFEGDFVSSIESFITRQPSLFSIETIEPVSLYALSKTDFDEMMSSSSSMKKEFDDLIFSRLLSYQKLFLERIKNNPERRYHELLASNPEILLRVPQHYIASFLGITSVSLSRIRNRR